MALCSRATLALSIALLAGPASAQSGSAEGEPGVVGDAAVVVLIGPTGQNAQLAGVLSELLLRQGVQLQFMAEPRFSQDALLQRGGDDARVWVFIAVDGSQRARLYFRGPFGERFLLRELALRDGLDELGRELIARVVETSTVALLRSHEGLSRAQAEADLARSAEQTAEPAQEPPADAAPTAVPADRAEAAAEPESARAPARWLLGGRALVHYTGSDLGARYGLGVEVGSLLLATQPRLRARFAFEPSLPQRLQSADVDATVMSWPLRLGLDVGLAAAAHSFWLALATGVDLVRIAPERTRDPALTLSEASVDALPVSRAELRYELALGGAVLQLALLLDVPWTASRYDAIEAGQRHELAKPWRLRPGIALGCAAEL